MLDLQEAPPPPKGRVGLGSCWQELVEGKICENIAAAVDCSIEEKRERRLFHITSISILQFSILVTKGAKILMFTFTL